MNAERIWETIAETIAPATDYEEFSPKFVLFLSWSLFEKRYRFRYWFKSQVTERRPDSCKLFPCVSSQVRLIILNEPFPQTWLWNFYFRWSKKADIPRIRICWFHGSSFKVFSIVFPLFWLAKVESSQKSNRTWYFGHFFAPICSAVTETIRVTNYATSFGAEKMFRKPSLKLLRWFLIRGTNKICNTNVANVDKKMDHILELMLCEMWTPSIVLKFENPPLYSSLWQAEGSSIRETHEKTHWHQNYQNISLAMFFFYLEVSFLLLA